MALDSRIEEPRLGVVLLGITVVLALLGVGIVFESCEDNLALQGVPATSFVISYDNETETLTATHDGGDTIADDDRTVALYLRVRDSVTRTTERYTWANETVGGFPVGPNDRITVRNVTLDGQPLDGGDVITVIHRGYERPSHCLHRNVYNATVARKTINPSGG